MKSIENRIEAILFGARWLAAPIYLGLILALVMLLFVFVREIVAAAGHMLTMELDEAVLTALSFIDIALVANLVLIVILAGYENFVSKIDTEDHEDRPSWMGQIDYAGLKLKLFSSIVALTGIELLKAFMALRTPSPPNPETLRWLVAVHVAFLLTALGSAVTDWISSRSKLKG